MQQWNEIKYADEKYGTVIVWSEEMVTPRPANMDKKKNWTCALTGDVLNPSHWWYMRNPLERNEYSSFYGIWNKKGQEESAAEALREFEYFLKESRSVVEFRDDIEKQKCADFWWRAEVAYRDLLRKVYEFKRQFKNFMGI